MKPKTAMRLATGVGSITVVATVLSLSGEPDVGRKLEIPAAGRAVEASWATPWHASWTAWDPPRTNADRAPSTAGLRRRSSVQAEDLGPSPWTAWAAAAVPMSPESTHPFAGSVSNSNSGSGSGSDSDSDSDSDSVTITIPHRVSVTMPSYSGGTNPSVKAPTYEEGTDPSVEQDGRTVVVDPGESGTLTAPEADPGEPGTVTLPRVSVE